MDGTAVRSPERIGFRARVRPWSGAREPVEAAARRPFSAADRRRVMAGLLFGMVGLGLIWRVARFAAGAPFWYDEAYIAVNLLVRDFAGILRPPEYFQIAPLGFFAIERMAILLLGPAEWTMRLVPFVAGIAGLVLFERFARATVDRRSALMAVAIFAASYYPVRHSAEVKPYSIDLLASLATMMLGWSLWRDRDGPGRWLALTALIAVGVWFSYPLIFVAASVGLMLTIRAWTSPNFRVLRSWAILGVVASASWLAMYLTVARPQAEAAPFYSKSDTWDGAFPPSWKEPRRLVNWLIDVHTGNMLAYPAGGNTFGSIGTAALVAFGCYSLRRYRSTLIAFLLLPLVPTFLASCFHRYPYGTSARTMLYMAPSFCLLAGIGLASLFRRVFPGRRRVRALAATSAILGGVMVVASVGNVARPFREQFDVDNLNVVLKLANMARPGDRWIAYDGVRSIRLQDDLMSERWIGQTAEIRCDILTHAPVPVQWMPEPDEVEIATGGRTWLIVHKTSYFEFDKEQLEAHRANLEARLGPPRVHKFPLSRLVSVTAYEYSPPASTSRDVAGSSP